MGCHASRIDPHAKLCHNRGMVKTSQPTRRRFQFSIRFLLILTAIVAVLMPIGVRVYYRRVIDERTLRFIQAVQNGDLAETNRLLRIDRRLALRRPTGRVSSSHTPLQLALGFGGNPKVVDRILQEGPDLDERSSMGQTALHMAVMQQMVSDVARLLQLGADPNIADDQGTTPVHLAAQVDRSGQITKLLLADGGDPNKSQPNGPRFHGRLPIHLAAERGNVAAVQSLLDGGARVSCRDVKGQTALHVALSRNRRKVAEFLIDHGADLTTQDDAGQIPGECGDGSNSEIAALLWWDLLVRSHDQGEIAKLNDMLDAAPQALSFRTEYTPATVLHRAVAERRLDVLDYLLTCPVDVEVRGPDGQTPLHTACNFHIPADFARHLIDAGANVEAKNEFGQTPLHAAVRAHNHDVLQVLIGEGADVDALDSAGMTVMDAAFERDFHSSSGRRTLELLTQAGHAPTVLYAAVSGDIELLRKLIRDNPDALDRPYTCNGLRPLHAAVLGKQPGIVRWLVENGVSCDPASTDVPKGIPVDSPLMIALSYSMSDMADLLLKCGADMNCRGRTGMTPIHAVIEWDRGPKLLETLLAHGADPTIEYEDKTAAELAANSKSENRRRYLQLVGAGGNEE